MSNKFADETKEKRKNKEERRGAGVSPPVPTFFCRTDDTDHPRWIRAGVRLEVGAAK